MSAAREIFYSKNAYVCSTHFQLADYARDLKRELLGLPQQKKLLPDAVPNVFMDRNALMVHSTEEPPTQTTKDAAVSARKERISIRNRKRLVEDLLMEALPEHELDEDQLNKPTEEDLNRKLEELQLQITMQKGKLCKQSKIIIYLRKKIANIKKSTKVHCRHSTKSIFSKAQKKVIQGQKRVNWSNKDIIKALSVRSISLKAYETIREKWQIPLPCPRTLRLWIHRFECAPGIQYDILNIKAELGSELEVVKKLCVLSFDEISINSNYVQDKTFDCIISHSKAQVVMIRGLYDPWKQPIYFKFDTPMTKPELLDVIKEVSDANYQVVSIVCDLGGENRALRKDFGISGENVSFPHPTDDTQEIFVFACTPHLIKLLRNHLVDDGVQLADGTIINRKTLEGKNLLNYVLKYESSV